MNEFFATFVGERCPLGTFFMPTGGPDANGRAVRFKGVYCIRCIPTGDCYVGQSDNLRNRITGHRSGLMLGNHPNNKMQALFNAHGISGFEVVILDEMGLDDLGQVERCWIRFLNPSLNAKTINPATGRYHDMTRNKPPREIQSRRATEFWERWRAKNGKSEPNTAKPKTRGTR